MKNIKNGLLSIGISVTIMLLAALGIYATVEHMDVKQIATAVLEMQQATNTSQEQSDKAPIYTDPEFECDPHFAVATWAGNSNFVQDYGNAGHWFRLKDPSGNSTWYCVEAGGPIRGLSSPSYQDLFNEVQGHQFVTLPDKEDDSQWDEHFMDGEIVYPESRLKLTGYGYWGNGHKYDTGVELTDRHGNRRIYKKLDAYL